MALDLFIAAIVLSGIVGSLSAMAGQLYERRKWERRLLERAGLAELAGVPAPPVAASPPPRHSDERLDRLEQAVDAIAVEMERVGEGQRFMTKLLADRRGDRTSAHTPPSPIPGAVRSASRPTA